MSLTPFNDPFFSHDLGWNWPMRSRMLDQYFGMGLFNDPFFRSPFYTYPGFNGGMDVQERTGFSEVKNEKDKFVVKMDVSHFKPEEIKVKTVDSFLVVEGNHEEKRDEHGYITRSFTRRYQLPKGVDVAAMNSSLNQEGILTIQAPKLAIQPPPETPIPIQAAPSEGQEQTKAKKG